MSSITSTLLAKAAAPSAPVMTPRIRRMLGSLEAVRAGRFSVGVVKSRLMTESFKATEGEPQVIRCAKALAHVLANVPVFIEPDDMLLGNLASKPGGLELSCLWSTWSDVDIDALNAAGMTVADEDRAEIRAMNDYWRPRSLTNRMTQLYDEERLWPYAQLGVVLPAFRSKEEGWGPGGMIGCGWGIHHEISQIIGVFQYEKVLQHGVDAIIAEAEAELRATPVTSAENVEKIDLLKAVIIAWRGVLHYAERFAALAEQSAAGEGDPARKAELAALAAACRRVPAQPARTFQEAMQSLWFTVLVLLPAGILSFGRLDQLLQPFYAADVAAGRIDDAAVLEYLQWLRIKDSQIVITAGQTHRTKYGGLAKWHNMAVGGQTPDGRDATNPLSFLILQAALDTRAPHPTLTLRVHAGTPQPLLDKAAELLASGMGLPSFIGDDSCIEFLQRHDVPLEIARDYGLAGCLGVSIPGRSRMVASPMFCVPLVFEFALYGGVDPRTGNQVGPETPPLAQCASFEAFYEAFKTQLGHFAALQAEFNNVTIRSYGERYPQPIESALTEGGLQASKNVLGRTMLFENGSAINPIGVINAVDALAAIRKVVFEDHAVTTAQLHEALKSNWAGDEGERIRDLMLAAPKFGNDDDAADLIAADIYRFMVETVETFTTTYGGHCVGSALTIGTANYPGGAQVGATPDGRRAGEPLADEALSPVRGRDVSGPLAILRSAAKVDQAAWQATSLDFRLHPDALADAAGVAEVTGMIRDYFAAGGKHVQFNVLDSAALRAAQADPDAHKDLIVRIGGCSAYFAQLPPAVQNEFIERTEYRRIG